MRISGMPCSFRVLVLLIADIPFVPAVASEQEVQPAKRQPAVLPASRTDTYGDPLPPGALARMGTSRDYIGDGSSRIIFSPAGRFVTASSSFIRPPLRLWDPATGRVVRDLKELDIAGIGVEC